MADLLQIIDSAPIQVVAGYKGTSEVRLAAEAGEVAGLCGLPHLPPPAPAGIRDIAEFVPRVNLLHRHTSRREKPASPLFENLREVGH